jgi:hypothetical protein
VTPPASYSWPNAGYFPFELAVDAAGWWSYYPATPIGTPEVNFRTVSVAVTKNGVLLPEQLVKGIGNPAGGYDDAVAWAMPALTAPAPGTVDTYTVTINGAYSVTYDVLIFNAAVGDVTIDAVSFQGTPQVGVPLTVLATGVDPSNAYVYYGWYRGAELLRYGATYTPTADDVGSTLTVIASGSRVGYRPGTQASAPVTVELGMITPGTPVVAGVPEVDSTLTGSPGTWSPSGVELSYQWYADGAPIAGANGLDYTLTADDVDAWITFGVRGTLAGYSPQLGISQEIGPVLGGVQPPLGPTNQDLPAVRTGGTLASTGQGPLVLAVILVLAGVALGGARRKAFFQVRQP